MGQNLAIIWSTIPLADDDGDFPSRILNWFNEVRKYAWGAQWSPATGHYSQVIIFFRSIVLYTAPSFKAHLIGFNKVLLCEALIYFLLV